MLVLNTVREFAKRQRPFLRTSKAFANFSLGLLQPQEKEQ